MRSEAQKKADRKYYDKTYKNLQVSIKIDDYNFIDDLAKSRSMSKAGLIVKAMHYIHDNNIDLNTDDDDTMP